MAKINRQVAALLLLASLDFKEGNRKAAARNLQLASENEEFNETLEGLQDVVDEKTDPFLTAADDEDELDFDLDLGPGDELDAEDEEDEEEQSASLARTAKKKGVAGGKQTAADEPEQIGGNNGPEGADMDNVGEEIRQDAETARLRRVRANLAALARA